MARRLKDLALALVNATLLLAAVCLFLAWRVTSTVDGMIATFASHLEIVAPLREEVRGMTAEIAGLRADLAAMKPAEGEIDAEAMQAVQARVEKVEARLDKAGAGIDDLAQAPGQLVDQAIETAMHAAADEFARAVNDIRSCEPTAR